MRDIKFRAWSKKEGAMSKPFQMPYMLLNFTDEQGLGLMKTLTDEVVNQWTGLTDKNGVDIYEGDIVNTTAMGNDHHQRGSSDKLTVKYFCGNACLCFKGNEGGVPIYPLNVNHTLEVIGNIHENPGLLGE